MTERDAYYMNRALRLAWRAMEEGDVPVGAVLLAGEEILGEGWNRGRILNDPTAHAEMMAIRIAASRTGNYRLSGATLYVTLEPCFMCFGAIEMERRALVLDPKNVTARISLGIAEGNTGHFRKELLDENAVIHDHPEREAAWAALGWAYASLGKWKEARFSEEKAVALRPSDSGARMVLGLALAHEGYLQEALLMEESAQKLNPGDEGIRRSLTFIRQEMTPPAPSEKPKNGFNPLLAPTPAPSSATATPGASQQMSPAPIRAPSVLH